MEPTLSYLRQTRLDGTRDYGQPMCSTCNQKTYVDYWAITPSKVVQCNAMKFTKNLMRYVHLKDTKTLWENHNSP